MQNLKVVDLLWKKWEPIESNGFKIATLVKIKSCRLIVKTIKETIESNRFIFITIYVKLESSRLIVKTI